MFANYLEDIQTDIQMDIQAARPFWNGIFVNTNQDKKALFARGWNGSTEPITRERL